MSGATVYALFKSKEGVIRALVEGDFSVQSTKPPWTDSMQRPIRSTR